MTQICVGALLAYDGCILLGRRSADRAASPGVWDVPGGHCEQGESLGQALARELSEEIGVTLRSWRELAVLRGPDGVGTDYELRLCVVVAWDGNSVNLQPEEQQCILDNLNLPRGSNEEFLQVVGRSRQRGRRRRQPWPETVVAETCSAAPGRAVGVAPQCPPALPLRRHLA